MGECSKKCRLSSSMVCVNFACRNAVGIQLDSFKVDIFPCALWSLGLLRPQDLGHGRRCSCRHQPQSPGSENAKSDIFTHSTHVPSCWDVLFAVLFQQDILSFAIFVQNQHFNATGPQEKISSAKYTKHVFISFWTSRNISVQKMK